MRKGVLLLTVGIVLAAASVAQAATYRVTKRGDHAPGGCSRADCTLREAILAANRTTGRTDRVVLPSRKPYRLAIPGGLEDEGATGDFDVLNDRLLIVHPGKGRATVSGSRVDRVFDAYAPFTVRKLVLTRGKALRYGGGDQGGSPVERGRLGDQGERVRQLRRRHPHASPLSPSHHPIERGRKQVRARGWRQQQLLRHRRSTHHDSQHDRPQPGRHRQLRRLRRLRRRHVLSDPPRFPVEDREQHLRG